MPEPRRGDRSPRRARRAGFVHGSKAFGGQFPDREGHPEPRLGLAESTLTRLCRASASSRSSDPDLAGCIGDATALPGKPRNGLTDGLEVRDPRMRDVARPPPFLFLENISWSARNTFGGTSSATAPPKPNVQGRTTGLRATEWAPSRPRVWTRRATGSASFN